MVLGATLLSGKFVPHSKNLGASPLVEIDSKTARLNILFQGQIRTNGKVFSLVSMVSAYIKTFIFEEKRL